MLWLLGDHSVFCLGWVSLLQFLVSGCAFCSKCNIIRIQCNKASVTGLVKGLTLIPRGCLCKENGVEETVEAILSNRGKALLLSETVGIS